MMRTAIGLSFLLVLAIGGVGACSGDKKDEATGNAGNAGDAGDAGSGGTNGASTAGSSGANSSAGSNASSGTGGGGAGLCAGKMNMCLDDQTVQGCDPETGMDFTVNCDDAPAGIINMGCSDTGDGTEACIIDFEDEECLDGAIVLAFCLNGGEAGLYNAYLNCYNDAMGEARDIITCLAPYLDVANATVDCNGLFECENVGAGGAPGAGGAGPDPEPMGGASGAE